MQKDVGSIGKKCHGKKGRNFHKGELTHLLQLQLLLLVLRAAVAAAAAAWTIRPGVSGRTHES